MKPVPVVVDIQLFVGAVALRDAYPPFKVPPPTTRNVFADALALIVSTGFFTLWLSDHITNNIRRVLVRRYRWPEDDAKGYVADIVEMATTTGGDVMNPTCTVTACPDYEDNRILELAVEVESPLVISDDYHLTEMNPWQGPHGQVAITYPREFRDSVVAKLRMLEARRRPR